MGISMTKWMSLLAIAMTVACNQTHAGEFNQLENFGDNPGQLTASYFKPEQASKNLVVLLHGCGQHGETLAQQSGFLQQAKMHNFALLVPQQDKSNNATICFNWFSKADQDKGQGETQSIMNMIKQTKAETKATDVYIAGLSAGGALTSSLLSHYPDSFKAGAVIAGIPYPCADNLIKAISCMKSGSELTAKQLAKSIHSSVVEWPNLTVISGSSDSVVNPKNSELMAQQWGYLTGAVKAKTSEKEGVKISNFGNVSELILISGMEHGMPVNPDLKAGGTEAAFVLKSSFSAADYLVNKWIVQ